jgi:hypothetical protein
MGLGIRTETTSMSKLSMIMTRSSSVPIGLWPQLIDSFIHAKFIVRCGIQC